MSEQDTFERLLETLHAAMLDETLWPATATLLDVACGTVGNSLIVREGAQADSRVSFVGLYYRGERREDWEREYLEVYHPINEGVARFRQLPDNSVVHTPELYTAAELQTSPTYNESFLKGHFQKSLQVRLLEPDGSHIAWSPHNPVDPTGWGAGQLAMVKAVLPHLRQFVRVRQALVKAEALGASMTTLLDNTRVGVIYLDRDEQIVEANARAHHILRQGDGVLSVRGGVLFARVPADRARLERLVAAALPTSSTPAVSGSMRLRRMSTLPPFVVHVKPVGVLQMDLGARRVAALMLITEPGYVSRIDPALVAATLDLTPVEGQIAALLAEGRTVREIAGALEYTERSVRWHLHQIYHKQGLAGQVDLVRQVLSVTAFA